MSDLDDSYATEDLDIQRLKENDNFKLLQDELKNKVISQCLQKIESQEKELQEVKAENIILKTHLSYILKRIIIEHYDLNNSSGNKRVGRIRFDNHDVKLRPYKKEVKSRFTPEGEFIEGEEGKNDEEREENYKDDDENSIYSCSKDAPVKFASNFNDVERRYLSTEMVPKKKSENTELDNKVNRYLNNIYKNNFCKTKGTSNQFSLNKKKGLYEELFPNKNLDAIKNDDTTTIDNEYCLTSPIKGGNRSVRNSTERSARTRSFAKRTEKKPRKNDYGYRSKRLNISQESTAKKERDNNSSERKAIKTTSNRGDKRSSYIVNKI